MNIEYANLETLRRFLENSKEIFSDKEHKHVISDITGLDDSLKYFAEKNAYAGIVNFPTVGKPGNIYIDTLTNKLYRWDDDTIKYYCVGSDYSEIDLIDCGGAT